MVEVAIEVQFDVGLEVGGRDDDLGSQDEPQVPLKLIWTLVSCPLVMISFWIMIRERETI